MCACVYVMEYCLATGGKNPVFCNRLDTVGEISQSPEDIFLWSGGTNIQSKKNVIYMCEIDI